MKKLLTMLFVMTFLTTSNTALSQHRWKNNNYRNNNHGNGNHHHGSVNLSIGATYGSAYGYGGYGYGGYGYSGCYTRPISTRCVQTETITVERPGHWVQEVKKEWRTVRSICVDGNGIEYECFPKKEFITTEWKYYYDD